MTAGIWKFGLAGALLFVNGAPLAAPSWNKLEQNTRTVQWLNVSRITVPQGSSRKIRITGPWMDYISSVTTSGGVSGRNIAHPASEQSTMILDAARTATRGDKSILVKVQCNWAAEILGCRTVSVSIPITVLEMGPINHIYPNGIVPPNTTVTFNLDGEGFDYGVILRRLTTLKNAEILTKNATTMRVRGTTPSCGFIDVSLSDRLDGDEFPYAKGTGIQQVIAGTICGTSIVPPAPSSFNPVCPPGQVFDWNTKICNDD
jgi:hypothetical protein